MIFAKKGFRTLTLVSILIIVTICSSHIYAQTISTVGEIYDFEINDIFHTNEWASAQWSGFEGYDNILITDKYYSDNGDTVFYTRNVNRYWAGTDNPDGSYDFYVDTIFYANLDSLINGGDIDTVYTTEDYNGRKVNFSGSPTYPYTYIKYIEGCGGSYYYLSYNTGESSVDHYFSLIYFKKGLEEWGTPHYVTGIDSPNSKHHLKIYPNPATDHLVLDLADQNCSLCSGIIYSISGKRIMEFSFSQIEANQLDISNLANGFYIIQLQVDDDFYSGSFVKN